MSTYDGKASLVFSSGDSFAECRLVAESGDAGWTGHLSDVLWRTQMVPSPLQPEEHLRLDDLPDRPVITVTVGEQGDGAADVSGEGDPFA